MVPRMKCEFDNGLLQTRVWRAIKNKDAKMAASSMGDSILGSFIDTRNTQRFHEHNAKNWNTYTGLPQEKMSRILKLTFDGANPDFIPASFVVLFECKDHNGKKYTFYFNLFEICRQKSAAQCTKMPGSSNSELTHFNGIFPWILNPITQLPFDKEQIESFSETFKRNIDEALAEKMSPSATFVKKKIDRLTRTVQTMSMGVILASVFLPAAWTPTSVVAMIYFLSSTLPVISYHLEIKKFKDLQIEKGKYIQHDQRLLHAGTWGSVLEEAQNEFTADKMNIAKLSDIGPIIEKRKLYKKYAYAIFYSTIGVLASSFADDTIIKTKRSSFSNIPNRYRKVLNDLKLNGISHLPAITKGTVPANLDQFMNGPLIKSGLFKHFTDWLAESNFCYVFSTLLHAPLGFMAYNKDISKAEYPEILVKMLDKLFLKSEILINYREFMVRSVFELFEKLGNTTVADIQYKLGGVTMCVDMLGDIFQSVQLKILNTNKPASDDDIVVVILQQSNEYMQIWHHQMLEAGYGKLFYVDMKYDDIHINLNNFDRTTQIFNTTIHEKTKSMLIDIAMGGFDIELNEIVLRDEQRWAAKFPMTLEFMLDPHAEQYLKHICTMTSVVNILKKRVEAKKNIIRTAVEKFKTPITQDTFYDADEHITDNIDVFYDS